MQQLGDVRLRQGRQLDALHRARALELVRDDAKLLRGRAGDEHHERGAAQLTGGAEEERPASGVERVYAIDHDE